MKLILLPLLVIIATAAEPVPPSVPISIKEVFSQLLTRDQADRVYSGQIKSAAGLQEFQAAYGVTLNADAVDFKTQMLVFGITDQITTRAVQFLKQEATRSYILDYADTGIMYKLRPPAAGKKYSHLQVFILDRVEGISHIEVRNLVRDGLSQVYPQTER